MTTGALVLFEALRLALRVLIVVLVVHFLRSTWLALRRPAPAPASEPGSWPVVTIQLPVRNEYYVVERAIRAAVALDYPEGALELQVLDDSTDETRERAAREVEAARAEGHDIHHVLRERPVGYKAGALAHGLGQARGELIAVFDADCIPPPDFLRRVVPHFHEPDVACVQVRWGFTNRNRNLLTRVQAIVLDGLFAVDQHARSTSRLPLQFNGTNGVWRRAAIDRAGGWSAETLAEDADLAFRAYLAGSRVLHLGDYAVPTELPVDMASFRAQQRRWATGSGQILRHLGLRILRSSLSPWAKLMMFMHLGRHAIDPLVLLALLTSPFTTLYGMPFLIDYGTALNVGLVALLALACLLFYGVALRRVGAARVNVLLVPGVLVLAIGLAPLYSVAFVRGVLSTGGAFVRTPKGGERGGAGPTYRAARDPFAWLEVVLAVAHGWFAIEAAEQQIWAYAAFFAVVSLSLAWVGGATLVGSTRAGSPIDPARAPG